ncbi:MAG: hypothetical protein LIP77_01400 [Planctomycetes bacterium]|nr:hypothetical protein [Planctomycetota bacterium]
MRQVWGTAVLILACLAGSLAAVEAVDTVDAADWDEIVEDAGEIARSAAREGRHIARQATRDAHRIADSFHEGWEEAED